MRAAHIIKATQIGGAERHLLILLPALRERGVDAHLIVLVEPGKPMDDLVALAEARGVPTERVVIRRDADMGLVWRLRAVLRRLRPRIVHTHLIHADLYGPLAAWLAGIRRVISSRHNDDDFRNHPMFRRFSAVQWRLLSAGLVISEAVGCFAVEIEGAPRRKLHTVPYGMTYTPLSDEARRAARKDLREGLGLAEDALIVGMACRLVEQKGLVYALRGFQPIADNIPNVYLVIAGNGPLLRELQRETRSLGITPRVRWLGWQSNVPGIMAGMDIFLMPSLWEGFGLVLLEAMSKRLPIVASDVSAIPEIVVHAETGLLVPPRDPEAIADALQVLLNDDPLRRYMGLLGEDRLDTVYSVERMAEATLGVYRAVAGH